MSTVDWRTATEPELRDAKAPWPKTLDELNALITTLAEREHDYGTCAYAVSIAATAAFNYMASRLGITGFQASCADMDVLTRTRMIAGPWRILDYSDMLFPQYEEKFEKRLRHATWEWIKGEAVRHLAEDPQPHPAVLAHWQSIADGTVPFGYTVEAE